MDLRRPAAWLTITLLSFLAMSSGAQDTSSDKKQIDFLNRGIPERLSNIRKQLRDNKVDLARSNIQQVTKVLEQIAGLTKRIREKEPGYTPNPPIDFDAKPATSRQKEYLEARRLAIDAGKQLLDDYQTANQALLKKKNQQIATIAISALKFTVENAPGRQGGKAMDLAVEGVKKLNSYLMDKYINAPITQISEVQLLKNNMISIQDGKKLVAHLQASIEKVKAFAKKMHASAGGLDSAVAAEKAWDKYRWLKQAGSGTVSIKVLDFQARDIELSINGVKLTGSSKGKTFRVPSVVILQAKVKDKRRKFCLDKKEYARKSTKTIIVHPGPGGGPEDSLVYSSQRIPAKSSWTIQEETFDYKPSFNSKVEDDPAAVTGAYWKLKRSRVRWTLPATPGKQVNVRVTGKIKWKFEGKIRGKRRTNEETNDGSATLVLQVLK